MTSDSPRVEKLWRLVVGRRGRARKGVVVLLYHRIASFCPDPQLLCVTPERFADQLQVIRRYFTSIGLLELKASIKSRDIPRRGVVVTLDDGYLDNLQNALPLLESFQVPATVFVTSGYVGKQDEMLSDALEHILLETEPLPATLRIRLGAQVHEWVLGDSPAQRSAWNVTLDNDPTPRHRCFRDLGRLLRPATAVQRQEAISQLFEWAGSACKPRPERRVMAARELQLIGRSGLVEIGAHTVNHLMLAQHPLDVQRTEIADSKRQLEQAIGRPVNSFAYPYGGKSAVDNRTIGCVREAGFDLACDNVPGAVGNDADPFALPRLLVRDWDGNEFRRRVESALAH